MTSKTLRVGDLVRYCDEPSELSIGDKSVGTIVGFSEATWRQNRAKVKWFNWCGSGPNKTTEYFNELEIISGESK